MESPCRVLVAEDDPLIRHLVVRLLEYLHLAPRAVSDGREVLEELESGSYDLVLMDCNMPGVDGFEATRRLRRQGRRVPVVAITASHPSMARDRCLAAGMDDFLAKPFDIFELRAVLGRWLPVPPAPRAAAAAE